MVDIKPPSVLSSKLPNVDNTAPSAIRNDNPISIQGATQAPKVSTVEQSIVKTVDVNGFGEIPKHLSKIALGIIEKSHKDALNAEIFEATVKRDKWVEQNINDPKTGIRQFKNRDAAGLPDKIGASYQAFSDTIKEGLSEQNRARWDVLSESTRVRIGVTTMDHTAKELDNYTKVNENALIESSKERARNDIADFGSAMVTGMTVLEQSLERQGIPVDSPAALIEKKKFTDDIVARAISGHVGTGRSSKNILEATNLLQKYSGDMSPEAVDKLSAGLDKAFRATTVNETVSSIMSEIVPQDKYESIDLSGVSDRVASYINDPELQLDVLNKIDAFAKQRDIEIKSSISSAEDDYLNRLKSGDPEETAKIALADIPLDKQYDIVNRQRKREVDSIKLQSSLSKDMGVSRVNIAKDNISIFINNGGGLNSLHSQIDNIDGISPSDKDSLKTFADNAYVKRSNLNESVNDIKAKDDISLATFNNALSHPELLLEDPDKPNSFGFDSMKSDLKPTHRAALLHIAQGLDKDGNIQAGIHDLRELFSKTFDGDLIISEGKNVGGIPAELTSEYSKMLDEYLVSTMSDNSADALNVLREKIATIRDEQLGNMFAYPLYAIGLLNPTPLSPSFLASTDVKIPLSAIGDGIVEHDVLQNYADKLGFTGRIIKLDSGKDVMMFNNNTMAYVNEDGNLEVRRNRGPVQP